MTGTSGGRGLDVRFAKSGGVVDEPAARRSGAAVLSKLKPKQIEAVSIEIARLETVAGTEQESVIYEFAESNPNALLGGGGGLDLAKSLVQRALGKDARDTLDTVQQSIEALPFGFLKKVDPQNLLTYIIDEHPQTIALILSHLPSGLRRADHRRPAAGTPDGGHPADCPHGADQSGSDQAGRRGARVAHGRA